MKSGKNVNQNSQELLHSFWNTDLDTIHKQNLGRKKVEKLPIALDDRVPPQGSVLLNRTVNTSQRSFLVKISRLLFKPLST